MHILYIDDNIYMRQTLKNMLSYLGYPNIFSANDGEEGWRIIQNEQVDMIISDLNMPGMNGVELLMNVRENRKFRNIPFLLISSEMNKESLHLAAEYDVDSVMLKPFDINKFRQNIVKSFERRAIPSVERNLIWKGEDAIQDSDIETLSKVLVQLETMRSKGRRIKEKKYLYFKAYHHIFSGEYEEVRKLIKPQIELNPFWVKFYDVVAHSYTEEKKYGEALKYLSKAVEVSPGNLERIIYSIKVAKRASQRNDVRELLYRLDESCTSFTEHIYKLLFEEYRISEEWDRVIRLYMRGVKEMKMERIPLFFHRSAAKALIEIDQKDKALEIFARLSKTVKKKNPEYPEILFEYGKLLEKFKRNGEAVAVLEKVHELFPEYAEESGVVSRIKTLKRSSQES